MTAVIDTIVSTLEVEGITLLPYDEEMSIPDFPHGSIQWEGFYKHHRIEEKTGYSAKMYADLEGKGLSITSVINSAYIEFNAADPKPFVDKVKQVMIDLYLSL